MTAVAEAPPRVPKYSVAKPRAAALALPERLTVSAWADKNRWLSPKTSAEPGRWNTARTPYMREPLDCIGDPGVEQITFMKPTQSGGTEMLFCGLAYAVDQDPGPALFTFPDQLLCKQVSKERIRPMFEDSPALAKHIPLEADKFTALEYIFPRMTVTLGWAGSPARLASRPVRWYFGDEIDKYPIFSGRESDPIKLARERTATFVANRKIVLASTPTTEDGYINREYLTSDQRKYYVPCPHCGLYQVLVFGYTREVEAETDEDMRVFRIKVPEGERDPEKIRSQRLAWYECDGCHGRIKDRHKTAMLAAGVWCPEGCTVNLDGEIEGDIPQTRHRGYWINALYSPWRTFSDVIAEFFDSKDSPAKLMNFINSWLAQVWHERAEEISLATVKGLAAGYEQGTVPPGCLVLVGGADVMKNTIYWTVRGWGAGRESWLIDCGVVGDMDRLEEIMIYRVFEGQDNPLQVSLGGIDSKYRGAEVRELCKKWPSRLYPVEGSSTAMAVPYLRTTTQRNARTGQIIKLGHAYWRIKTGHYKTEMMELMDGGKGLWHLYEGVDLDYLAHQVSEHRVIVQNKAGQNVGVWRKKGPGIQNHYYDCEVYALAMADIKKLFALRAVVSGNTGYSRAKAGSGWQIGR